MMRRVTVSFHVEQASDILNSQRKSRKNPFNFPARRDACESEVFHRDKHRLIKTLCLTHCDYTWNYEKHI